MIYTLLKYATIYICIYLTNVLFGRSWRRSRRLVITNWCVQAHAGQNVFSVFDMCGCIAWKAVKPNKSLSLMPVSACSVTKVPLKAFWHSLFRPSGSLFPGARIFLPYGPCCEAATWRHGPSFAACCKTPRTTIMPKVSNILEVLGERTTTISTCTSLYCAPREICNISHSVFGITLRIWRIWNISHRIRAVHFTDLGFN